MKSVTKLKDDARKHEQKEEWDKAIQAYLLVLKTGEEGEGELDLPLYNRVGDLYLRLSKPNDAVKYYVQAADRYAEAGLFNNAIALCNKALRYVPAQLDLLRKLGQFSASQGFLTDARRYFLEYAEKKFASGKVDDALTALEEFAEVSGDPEVREMLARQLQTHGRTEEAVNELVKAHAVRVKNGDRAGADALRIEIEALAPGTMADEAAPSAPTPSAYPSAPAVDEDEGEGFAIDLPDLPAEPEENTSLAGFESTALDAPSADDADGFQLQGFETTHAEPEVEDQDTFQLPDFETTAHEGAVVASDDLGLEPTAFEAPAGIDADALPDLQFDDSSFGASGDDDAHDDDAAFDLPLLGDDSDTASVSLDGETDDGDFALPDFQIDTPSDDAGEDHDDGGFELPILSDDADDSDDSRGAHDATGADDEEDAYDDQAIAAGNADLGISELSFDGTDTADLDSSAETAAESGSFDLGGLKVPTLAEDGFGGDDDMPMVDTQTVEEENLDDSAYEDFGEYRARPAGASKESPAAEEPEDEDQAFISDLMASAAPTETESAPEAEEQNAKARDEPATGGEAAVQETAPGGWDPSALGFDEPATPDAKPAAKPKSKGKAKDGSDYIDLGSFLTEDDEDEDNTRFRVQEVAPTGDEDRDFAELLSQFKQKVSENVSAEDSAAHYDLGLAFKEMGLVDEAIGEFQIAMRAGDMRLRVYEELGQCFLLKEQFNIAEKVLTRALTMQQGNDLEMIGVYYHLGRAYEGLGNRDAARDAYERVLGLDINFQDVAARLKRL